MLTVFEFSRTMYTHHPLVELSIFLTFLIGMSMAVTGVLLFAMLKSVGQEDVCKTVRQATLLIVAGISMMLFAPIAVYLLAVAAVGGLAYLVYKVLGGIKYACEVCRAK